MTLIPKEWDVKPLEEIAVVERGKFSARPRNDPRYYGGNIPFVQTGDVAAANGKLTSYTQTLNEEGLAVSRIFPENTILITIAANIGDAAITTFPVACPDSLVAIQAKNGTDIRWLLAYIQTRKPDLEAAATQNAQKNINLQVLRPLNVICPPEHEQKEISKIIKTLDQSTDELERLISYKREQKRALMQRLLTGKLRFPEFADQPWHSEKFSNLIIARDERATANNTLPIMTSSRRGLMLQSEYFGKQVASEDTSNYKIIRKCDFTYRSMSDDRQFFFNQLDSIDAGIISPAYAVFYTHNVDDTFFKYFICSDVFSRHLDGAIQGGTRVALKLAALMSVEAKLPSLPEQRKIAAVLSAADREIDQLTQKLDAYKLQKKGLMQQLLTGKKRVNIPSSQKEKHYA